MLTNLAQTLSIAAGAALIAAVDYRILLVVVTTVTAAAAYPGCSAQPGPGRPPHGASPHVAGTGTVASADWPIPWASACRCLYASGAATPGGP